MENKRDTSGRRCRVRLQFGPLLVRGKYVALLVMEVAHPWLRGLNILNIEKNVRLPSGDLCYLISGRHNRNQESLFSV